MHCEKKFHQQNIDDVTDIEGAFDMSKTSMNSIDQLSIWQVHVCGCSHTTTCIAIYHRCRIKNQTLRYPKCQSTISYFVQYSDDCYDTLFGSIEVFFKYKGSTFALIQIEIYSPIHFHLLTIIHFYQDASISTFIYFNRSHHRSIMYQWKKY